MKVDACSIYWIYLETNWNQSVCYTQARRRLLWGEMASQCHLLRRM